MGPVSTNGGQRRERGSEKLDPNGRACSQGVADPEPTPGSLHSTTCVLSAREVPRKADSCLGSLASKYHENIFQTAIFSLCRVKGFLSLSNKQDMQT